MYFGKFNDLATSQMLFSIPTQKQPRALDARKRGKFKFEFHGNKTGE